MCRVSNTIKRIDFRSSSHSKQMANNQLSSSLSDLHTQELRGILLRKDIIHGGLDLLVLMQTTHMVELH